MSRPAPSRSHISTEHVPARHGRRRSLSLNCTTMHHLKCILALTVMSIYFVCTIEARVRRPNFVDRLIYRKSRSEVNKKFSDPDREAQIRFSSVTSLEALLLETIRVGGSEICSSPLAQSVMHGTWRKGTPERDEMRDSQELRKTCGNALVRNNPTTAVPSGRSRMMPSSDSSSQVSPNRIFNISAQEELTFTLIRQPEPVVAAAMPIDMARRSRLGPEPTVPPKKDSPADPEVLQKANDIIKDRSADCKPRQIPVEIPKEPNTTWLPACAIVERCGGCCKHDSLHCVPVPENITKIKKKVVAVNNKGVLLKVKHVEIEKHGKCRCECKVKASDCNPLQSYDKNNCRCVCKQRKAGQTPKCNAPLYWDERSCKCRCPQQNVVECSTGSFFSSDQCRCVTANEIINEEMTKRM